MEGRVTEILSMEALALAAARRARQLLTEHADVVAKTGLMQATSPAEIRRLGVRPMTRESRKREVEPATNDSQGSGTKA